MYKQHRKQFKVQIIGILEEIGSFYWLKLHFLNKCQKYSGRGLSPLWGNAWKNFSPQEMFLREAIKNYLAFFFR